MLTDVEKERLKALNILLVDDSIARKQLSDALTASTSLTDGNNGLDAIDLDATPS